MAGVVSGAVGSKKRIAPTVEYLVIAGGGGGE